MLAANSQLTAQRVQQALGDDALAQWSRERNSARAYWATTADFERLPEGDIVNRLSSLAPTPGQEGFVDRGKIYDQAAAYANQVLQRRQADPAGAVTSFPEVKAAAAQASMNTPASYAPLVSARLAAQSKIGIPDSMQSPMSKDEADQFSTTLKQAVPGQERNVLQHVIKQMQGLYGDHTDQAIAYMLGQARFDAVTKTIMGSIFRKLSQGQTIPPSQARAFDDATKTQSADQAIKSVLGPQRPNFATPNSNAIEALRKDPNLAPAFDQKFGAGRAAQILSQTLKPAPVGGGNGW